MERCCDTCFQECSSILLTIKSRRKLGHQRPSVNGELRRNLELTRSSEGLNLALAFNHKAHCHGLHTSSGEIPLHLTPQDWLQPKSNQAVEHAPCLLRIHKICVDTARVLDSAKNCRLGDFVEYDATRLDWIKLQCL